MPSPFVVNLKNPEDSPEKIAEKLNSLTYAIDAKVIRGAVPREDFDSFKDKTTKYIDSNKERIDTNDLRWHGGGLPKVIHDTTLTGDGTTTNPLSAVATGSGTVTNVSVVSENGVSGSVANPTTTPAITLALGAITPTSTNGVPAATMAFMDATSSVQTQLNSKGSGTVTAIGVTTTNGVSGTSSGGATPNLTIALGNITPTSVNASGTLAGSNFSGSSSGTNTGDQTNISGNAATVTTNANLTGDVTSVGNATTLTNAPVIAKVLTGYTSGAGTVSATDSILQAIQKLNGNKATNANLTGPITSVGNATSIASQTGTGTKFVVDTSPTLITPTLGIATATSINGNIFTTGSSTYTGTAGQTYTFPSTTATIARTDAANTFTGVQTTTQVITTANAITASSNAATVPVTSRHNIVTNSSAATLTITLTTTSAVNMQMVVVQILDFSAVAQTIAWVNTENSLVTVPTTSNGSTTLPITVGFIYNSSTSKWRTIASA